jgi:hypothetical protein
MAGTALASDETGMRVGKANWWLRSANTGRNVRCEVQLPEREHSRTGGVKAKDVA